jgi:mannose-6-phosphate isomerase-like protein (cupin superfamily)
MHTDPPVRILGPSDGEVLGPPDGARDRFLLGGHDTGGAVAVVEHLMAPRCLAGPVHLHTREDEFTYVLEGRMAALLGDEEVVADAGSLVFKPRGQWHTFWNPDDTPARLLEVIVPSGLERLFREMGQRGDDLSVEEVREMAAAYGAQVDVERTAALVQERGLRF